MAALSVLGLFTVARSPQTLAPPGAPLERPRSSAPRPAARLRRSARARARAALGARGWTIKLRMSSRRTRSRKHEKVNISNKSENALCCQLRRAPAVIGVFYLLTHRPYTRVSIDEVQLTAERPIRKRLRSPGATSTCIRLAIGSGCRLRTLQKAAR